MNRRTYLKNSGIIGALFPINAKTPSSNGNIMDEGGEYLKGLQTVTAPFLELILQMDIPDDAISISSHRNFPAVMKSDKKIFNPVYNPEIFKNQNDAVIAATWTGLKRLADGKNHKLDQIPVNPSITGRGSFVAGGRIDAHLSATIDGTPYIKSDYNKIYLDKDGTTNVAVNMTYQTKKGQQSTYREAKLGMKYFDEQNIISHRNLIIIPKDSEGGRYIKEVIRPELKSQGSINGWANIFDLSQINAWGIKLKEGWK